MPRLIVPSNGGGTKLTRTLLADEAEGVCTGAGEAVPDSSGEIERAGDSSGVADTTGLGDSCAVATEAKMATRNVKLIFVVISSEVRLCRVISFSQDVERLTRLSPDSLAATLAAQPSMSLIPFAPFLDFARNDKWPRCNSASSRLEKGYRAIRSCAGILHRGHL